MSDFVISLSNAKAQLIDEVVTICDGDTLSILCMLIVCDDIDAVNDLVDEIDSRPELAGFTYGEAIQIGGFDIG